MYDKDALMELFSNSFAHEYMAYSEQLARRAAADIYAACEVMKDEPKKRKEAIELIMDRCREFLRTAQVSSIFSNALTEPSVPAVFEIDIFMNEFVVKARNVLGSKAEIAVSTTSRAIVKTDRALLTYFLLSYIRRYALLAYKSPEIAIRTEKTDSGAQVRISVKGDEPSDFYDTADSFFYSVNTQLDELFTEVTGIVCTYDEHELKMTVPLAENIDGTSLGAGTADTSDGPFSPFGVMLGDVR